MISELMIDGVAGSVYGVVLVTPPPMVSAPERGEWIEAGGRDGRIWRSDHAYDTLQVKLTVAILPGYDPADAIAWARSARTLGFTPENWVYHVSGCDLKPSLAWWEGLPDEGWQGDLTFTAQPYRWMEPCPAVRMTGAGTLFNPCTAPARPRITVRGSGDAVLTVGGYTVVIDDMSGEIVIDCEQRIAVDGDGMLATGKLSMSGPDDAGRWPRLDPGASEVSWSGGITSVEVEPRWRWL